MNNTAEPATARIPADIEVADKILFGCTGKQVAIVGGALAVLWVLYTATSDVLPLPVFAVIAVLVLGPAAAVALIKRDGIGLDRYLLAAARHATAPRRLVDAGEGIPPVPAWAAPAGRVELPAPLHLPARAVHDDGVIDLGGDGAAVIVECGTVSFALCSPAEQDALAGGFARWLNALSGPAQILARAERVSLAAAIGRLLQAAPALPHPALEQAALDHAAFLHDLDAGRDLLWRQVLVVIREPGTGLDAAAQRALRRADDTARRLSAAGVTARVLDGAAATAVLAAAADPSAPAPAGDRPATPHQIIRGML